MIDHKHDIKSELMRFAHDRYKIAMIIAIIICSFAEGWRQLLGVPIVHMGNAIIFVMFIWLILFGRIRAIKGSEAGIIVIGAMAFLLFGSLSALLYGVRPVLYLWSVRNYLRFFILFIDCYLVFDRDDVWFFCRLIDIVIVIHILLTLIQFCFYGIRWDYLNGIFGTQMGGAAGVNILLVINTCLCLYRWYERKLRWPLLYLHIF